MLLTFMSVSDRLITGLRLSYFLTKGCYDVIDHGSWLIVKSDKLLLVATLLTIFLWLWIKYCIVTVLHSHSYKINIP